MAERIDVQFRKRLKKFLRKNKCLNKYRRNVLKHAKKANIFLDSGEMPPMGSAFIWAGTTEGPAFWHELSTEFKSRLDA